MEHSNRDRKHHQNRCLDFFKFKNGELEKKVTNLEKDVRSLTRQNKTHLANEINFHNQNAEMRQNVEMLKNKLELTEKLLKEKREKLQKHSWTLDVPSVPNAPPRGHSIFNDLKARVRYGQLIQETG